MHHNNHGKINRPVSYLTLIYMQLETVGHLLLCSSFSMPLYLAHQLKMAHHAATADQIFGSWPILSTAVILTL